MSFARRYALLLRGGEDNSPTLPPTKGRSTINLINKCVRRDAGGDL